MDKHWSRTAAVRLGSVISVVAVLGGGLVWGGGSAKSGLAETQVTRGGLSPTENVVTETSFTKTAGATPLRGPAAALRALYRLTDVGSIGDQDEAEAALNNLGEVVLSDGSRGYLWRAGHRTPLSPFTKESMVTVGGINDRGEIVGGDSVTQSGAVTMTNGDAVLWHGGKVVSLGSLPSLSDASAAAINERGQVVGNSRSASFLEFQDTMTGVTHAFLWERGKMTDLGDCPEQCGPGCRVARVQSCRGQYPHQRVARRALGSGQVA